MRGLRPVTRRPAPASVVVCRGCCCGTAAKHPDVDHAAHLERIRRAAAQAPVPVRVQVADCLSACEHSNVVVVRPAPARTDNERRRQRPVWLGHLADDGAVADLAAWVAAGGPEHADLPAALELNVLRPPRDAAAG